MQGEGGMLPFPPAELLRNHSAPSRPMGGSEQQPPNRSAASRVPAGPLRNGRPPQLTKPFSAPPLPREGRNKIASLTTTQWRIFKHHFVKDTTEHVLCTLILDDGVQK